MLFASSRKNQNKMAASSAAAWFLLLAISVTNAPFAMSSNRAACMPVVAPLLPCLISFSTMNNITKPSESCCTGASLVAMGAKTKLGKIFVCSCIKRLMLDLPMITPRKAQSTTKQCSVDLPIPHYDTNCIL